MQLPLQPARSLSYARRVATLRRYFRGRESKRGIEIVVSGSAPRGPEEDDHLRLAHRSLSVGTESRRRRADRRKSVWWHRNHEQLWCLRNSSRSPGQGSGPIDALLFRSRHGFILRGTDQFQDSLNDVILS